MHSVCTFLSGIGTDGDCGHGALTGTQGYVWTWDLRFTAGLGNAGIDRPAQALVGLRIVR